MKVYEKIKSQGFTTLEMFDLIKGEATYYIVDQSTEEEAHYLCIREGDNTWSFDAYNYSEAVNTCKADFMARG